MTRTLAGRPTGITATVGSAADGDVAAFERLVEAHHPLLLRVAYLITGDIESARDAAQAAWMIAWRRLDGVREPTRIRAWLAAITANEARKVVGRSRREWPHLATIEERVADLGDHVSRIDLIKALQDLGDEERALIVLRYLVGLDSTEIAAQLGITSSGVRSRLARTLGRLRSAMGDPEEVDR